MFSRKMSAWRVFAFTALLAAVSCPAAPASSGDIYDAAVRYTGRSADDLKRDTTDRPADVLRLAGIKSGMQVADVLAGDGYYSELLGHVVGPRGHVLLLNNPAFDAFSNNAWRARIDKHHLGNVEHRTVDLAHMNLGDATLDAVVLVKVYHDLYWVSPQDGWPKIDAGAVLDQIVRALKPGGIVLLVDHSAKPGTGSSAAQDLHRIDEAYARRDFETHGPQVAGHSDVLRRPDDARDQISYKPPMLGKTDRFVYVFRKP